MALQGQSQTLQMMKESAPISINIQNPCYLAHLAPPGPGQFWPPTVDVNSFTGPIHGDPTTLINGRDQQPNGPIIPHHALLPNDDSRSSDSLPCIHIVATSGTVNTPTTKSNVTTETTEQGNQPNPKLPQRVQYRPGENTGKIKSPKVKSATHVRDS